VSVPDAVTERFRAQADQWRDIAKTNDDAAAQLVRDDRIDILIDLAGHTSGHRLLVFARRPAPVQVTYQGYPNTTGLNQIQYRLTDALADPPGATDACYAERLIRLPRTGWCYQPPDPAPDVAPPPALSNGFVTFGSFNRLSKVSPAIAQLWSRVVSAVPGSRFVFKTFGLEDPATAEYVRGMFKQHGLEPDRLILLPPAPSALAHLEMYAQMDVALDTYPYHGTTTTCEALWMGVPTIALVGAVHASRVSFSLLSNIGLADLAAQSPDEFVEAAARTAGDVPRLAELRRTMRDRMRASPLMDAAAFCRDVEAAYRQMWRAWCESGG
jgi:predicted O-linked N-acetylglucosamine transferase (SPINDLY family)